MLKKRAPTSLFSIAALCAVLASPQLIPAARANGAGSTEFSDRVCVAMPEMLALESALSAGTLQSLARAGATIAIADGGSNYILRNGSRQLGTPP